MSKTVKIGLMVVVVLAAAGVLVWSGTNRQPAQAPRNGGAQPGTSVSASATTDAAINASLSKMDSQMGSFAADTANIDNGLNDKPVPQQQL